MADTTVTNTPFPFASVPQVFGLCAFNSKWCGSTKTGRIFACCLFGISALLIVYHIYAMVVFVELTERADGEANTTSQKIPVKSAPQVSEVEIPKLITNDDGSLNAAGLENIVG